MVGVQWSEEEERCFWQRIIPISPSRGGIDVVTRDENKWKELVPLMERWMGEEARRHYTAQMLYEHWYQNYQRSFSPNAFQFVRTYLISIGEDPEAPRPSRPGSSGRRGGIRKSIRGTGSRGNRSSQQSFRGSRNGSGRSTISSPSPRNGTNNPSHTHSEANSLGGTPSAATLEDPTCYQLAATVPSSSQQVQAPFAIMTMEPPIHDFVARPSPGEPPYCNRTPRSADSDIREAALHLTELAASGHIVSPSADRSEHGGSYFGSVASGGSDSGYGNYSSNPLTIQGQHRQFREVPNAYRISHARQNPPVEQLAYPESTSVTDAYGHSHRIIAPGALAQDPIHGPNQMPPPLPPRLLAHTEQRYSPIKEGFARGTFFGPSPTGVPPNSDSRLQLCPRVVWRAAVAEASQRQETASIQNREPLQSGQEMVRINSVSDDGSGEC